MACAVLIPRPYGMESGHCKSGHCWLVCSLYTAADDLRVFKACLAVDWLVNHRLCLFMLLEIFNIKTFAHSVWVVRWTYVYTLVINWGLFGNHGNYYVVLTTISCVDWGNYKQLSFPSSTNTWISVQNTVQQETLRGRKLSQISRFCGYPQKFSLRNLGAWCPLAWQKRAIHEIFLRENCIYHQFAKVFPLGSFPLYSMWGLDVASWRERHIWHKDKNPLLNDILVTWEQVGMDTRL